MAKGEVQMARYKKTYDKQIETLNEQIMKVEEKLNNLIAQRDELIERKQQEELQELYHKLKENNLTIDEVLSMLPNQDIA